MKAALRILASAATVLWLGGCGSSELNPISAIEAQPISLSGEQVLLTPEQVTCGDKRGLWLVSQIDGGGAIGRLLPAAHALDFGDDVRMGDRRFRNPYVQLRGSFALKVQKVLKVTEESSNVKVVEASVGAIIPHECFTAPLPLLGVERGDFSPEAPPRIRLRLHESWTVDGIVH